MSSTMKKCVLGFTLIELLVVITVMAILLTIAVPNMSIFIKANRVQTQVQTLASQLNYARSEALSRGYSVTVCRSDDPTATNPTCGGSWSNGWIIFLDNNSSGAMGVVDSGEQILRVSNSMGNNSLRVFESTAAAAQNFITFKRDGTANNVAGVVSSTFAICDVDKNVKYARAVLVEKSGKVLLSSANSSGIYTDFSGNALTCP